MRAATTPRGGLDRLKILGTHAGLQFCVSGDKNQECLAQNMGPRTEI